MSIYNIELSEECNLAEWGCSIEYLCRHDPLRLTVDVVHMEYVLGKYMRILSHPLNGNGTFVFVTYKEVDSLELTYYTAIRKGLTSYATHV